MLNVKMLQALLNREMADSLPYIKNILIVTLDGGILACGERQPRDCTYTSSPTSSFSPISSYSSPMHLSSSLQKYDKYGNPSNIADINTNAFFLQHSKHDGSKKQNSINKNVVDMSGRCCTASSSSYPAGYLDGNGNIKMGVGSGMGGIIPSKSIFPLSSTKGGSGVGIGGGKVNADCGILNGSNSILNTSNSENFDEFSEIEQSTFKKLQTVAALLVSFYNEYASLAANFESLIVDCDHGKACVGSLQSGALVLCIFGDEYAPFGALQLKYSRLHAHLSDVLKDLY